MIDRLFPFMLITSRETDAIFNSYNTKFRVRAVECVKTIAFLSCQCATV